MRYLSLALILSITLGIQVGLASGDQTQLVIIKDYKFIPQEITIKQGQTLRWENQEKRQYHSVWFEALNEEEPEDYLFPEEVYEREFNKPGSYPYRCGPHPDMTGIVRVTE
ncbi:MAG: cupredoxin domain-containing protein [Gammaproteobacteria bacterium]|nr:cupredoxin domain-containing protein [Gammaproteobacteria bacterium]